MFLIFAGDNYYPAGGAEDLKEVTQSGQIARDLFNYYRGACDWCNVYNTVKREIVFNSYNLINNK